MIKVEKLSRRYGDFAAVDDVSFTISPGEIVGLLGHNGAGKTTIMKMLTGYLEPTAGNIAINDCDVVKQRQKVQENIGYLPENCPVYPEMTVVDYLDYSASLHNIPKEQRDSLVAEAIEKTALTDKAHNTLATLSRGYRQRTGVAQAILHKPKILILDEPTNGLDPTQIQQMRELIKDLANHSTVIISTHILQEVQAICDRVIIIRNGKLALDTRLDGLQADNRLLVTVGSSAQDGEAVLQKIEGITSVGRMTSAPSDGICFALGLAENSNRTETAATVAGVVHEQGWRLYGLQYEAKDLETVFAQTSAQ